MTNDSTLPPEEPSKSIDDGTARAEPDETERSQPESLSDEDIVVEEVVIDTTIRRAGSHDSDRRPVEDDDQGPGMDWPC